MPKPEGVKKTWFALNCEEADEVYVANDSKNLPIASPIYKTSEDIGLSEKFPFSQRANGDGGCYFYSGMIAILNDCVGDAENWNSVRGNLIRIAGEDGEFKALIDEISPENAVLTREKVYEILQVRGEENIIAKLGDKLLVKGIDYSSEKTTWGLDHFLTQANEALKEYLKIGVVALESLKDQKLIEGIEFISSEEMLYLSDEHFDSQDQDLRRLCEGVIRCQWAIENRRRPGTYNAEYISPFFQEIYPTKRIVAITRRDLARTVVEAGELYLWNADGQAHFDVLYPDLDGKIAADVAELARPISEPEVETLGGKATETITKKVEQFVANLDRKYAAPKAKGSEVSPLDNLPSPYATRAFLESRVEEQNRILEGTRITITRAEFDHAKHFLALIALTEGQQIPGKRSQKQIYVDQKILPEGLALAAEDGDLKAKIEEISEKITPEHIKAFYKRLVEKRPLASLNKFDDTLLRDGKELKGIGCSGTYDPEQYTLYSEAEFASMLQVFGPTQFINDGRRDNQGQVGTEGGGEAYETSGYISGLVGMRLEVTDGMESVHVVEGNLTKLKDAHADSPAPAWGGDQKGDFGRIFGVTSKFVEGYEAIWQKFYEDKKGELGEEEVATNEFDKAAAEYRLYISYKKFLAESANAIAERERERKREEGGEKKEEEKAYIRITGLGDGVWAFPEDFAQGEERKIMDEIRAARRDEIRAAIGRAVARAYDELAPELKARISAIEFSEHEEHGLSSTAFSEAPILEGAFDPQPELRVSNGHFAHKIPAAAAEFKNVLFVNYAWDGLSYPGNEYYFRALNASGDPAAACCSSIVVSQNPQINSGFLDRVFVVEENGIIKKLDGYGAKAPELELDFDTIHTLTIPELIEAPSLKVDPVIRGEGESDSSSEDGSENSELDEDHDLSVFEEGSGDEFDLEEKSNEDFKYEALRAMQEIQKESVFDNKLARAFTKLEGKSVVEAKPDFEEIWKEELTTLDRKNLVEFYNKENPTETISPDKNCMNTLDLKRDGDLWKGNKENLSKIISWSIDIANKEESKTRIERIISDAKASNKRFHGISSKEKGEIEEGVKQFREYRRGVSLSGEVLNPIAQALVGKFPQKGK